MIGPFELHRKFPTYIRPLPFAAGWVFALIGLFFGLNWVWKFSLFSGSILAQTLISNTLINFASPRIIWFILGLAGLGVLGYSFGSRKSKGVGLLATRWRFYPLSALLGLFLVVYGATFLFDINVFFDTTPGVIVMFTSVNYAGIPHRIIAAIVGLAVLGAGGFVLARHTLSFNLGIDEGAGVKLKEPPPLRNLIQPAPSEPAARTTASRSVRPAQATSRRGGRTPSRARPPPTGRRRLKAE